jgi:hypothetical protein
MDDFPAAFPAILTQCFDNYAREIVHQIGELGVLAAHLPGHPPSAPVPSVRSALLPDHRRRASTVQECIVSRHQTFSPSISSAACGISCLLTYGGIANPRAISLPQVVIAAGCKKFYIIYACRSTGSPTKGRTVREHALAV